MPSRATTLRKRLRVLQIALSVVHVVLIYMRQSVSNLPLLLHAATFQYSEERGFSQIYGRQCLQYDDDEFYRHYRMKRSAFDTLHGQIHPRIQQLHSTYYEISIIHLLSSIFYLSTLETFRELEQLFGASASAIYRFLFRNAKLISTNLAPIYITWPTASQQRISRESQWNFSALRGIIGAIDGTHIPIKKPVINVQEAYCNRKGFHSINVQAIVNHKGQFIDVISGHPGSIGDGRMLYRSGMYERHSQLILGDGYILGDSAYPLTTWLIVPYSERGGHILSEEEKDFNYHLSSARVKVEQAFGRLKTRWRRLLFLIDSLNITFINAIIITAFTLHNFCESANDIWEEDPVPLIDVNEDDIDEQLDISLNNTDVVSARRSAAEYRKALGKRTEMMEFIRDNVPRRMSMNMQSQNNDRGVNVSQNSNQNVNDNGQNLESNNQNQNEIQNVRNRRFPKRNYLELIQSHSRHSRQRVS